MEQSDHDYLVEVLSGSGGTNPDKEVVDGPT